MTNEQKEAIDRLKEIQESNRTWLMQTEEENCKKIYLKDIEAIDTVLSLIKEKQKEIENYKNMIIEHKKQLKQSGIYGYDYDLKID